MANSSEYRRATALPSIRGEPETALYRTSARRRRGIAVSSYLAGATMDANGRLELLRPIGMHPASNKTSMRQTRFFNCVPA